MDYKMSRRGTRRIFILLLLVVLSAIVLVLSGTKEKRVEQFVLRHQVELEEIAQACMTYEPYTRTYQNVRVEGLFNGENPIVQFFYSGCGIAPASKYTGFYYSVNDVPTAYQNVSYPLEQTGEKQWTWKEEAGDNGGITVRITAHWFYYEAWF